MTEVHLRRITAAIEEACLGLRVGDDQVGFVATNAQSLDQAKANPGLVPLAIYELIPLLAYGPTCESWPRQETR